jgi:hypothetical protein
MIQKIRSYLLDDQENKDSLGWYVVIIILAPMLGIFFQYKREKSPYLGTVNDKPIDKNIFFIKSFEQSQLIENLTRIFGEAQIQHLFDILFKGKSPKDYLVSNEIKRLFIASLFEKNISSRSISDRYIFEKMKFKENNKIKMLLGEFFYLLITDAMPKDFSLKRHIDMNKVDTYCQEMVSVAMMNNIFYAPLSSVQYACNKDSLIDPLIINFDIYEADYSLLLKNASHLINELSHHEMNYFYDTAIKQGKFKKDLISSFRITVFTLSKEKDFNDADFNEMVEKKYFTLLSDVEKDFSTYNAILSKNFITKEKAKDLTLTLKENGDVISQGIVLSQNVRSQISEHILSSKNPFYVIIENGCIYFFETISIPQVEYKKFEEAKEHIVAGLTEKKIKERVLADSDSLRYSCEEGLAEMGIVPSYWKKSSFEFSALESDGQKEAKKEGPQNFSSIVMRKLSFNGIPKRGSFIIEAGNKLSVCVVRSYTLDEKRKSNKRRFIESNDIYSENSNVVDNYTDSLLKYAKVNINNDVSL